MEFLLEGWGEVCGHLSNGIAGGVADPWVLRRRKRSQTQSWFVYRTYRLMSLQVRTCVGYLILAEQEDEADNLLEDGLHLLVAALANGRQRHQPGVAVLPVS